MGFLDNYEDVNARIKRFRTEFPSGRLVAYIEDIDIIKGTVLVKAEAYREYEDAVPSAVDYAFGNVATLTNNMKKWLIEDTVTSAYGRVIGLLTPSEHARPTVQDMQKVETLPADPDPWSTKAAIEDMPTMGSVIAQEGAILLNGTNEIKEAPQCSHGHMVWKQSHEGAPKSWGGYFCTERTKATQCTPRWYVLRSTGKWEPQV